MKEYLFVGETRSEQAKKNGWSWEQGVSTAKYLFDALRDVGITPEEQEYTNLWNDEGELQEIQTNKKVVGMGKVVQTKLKELGVEHIGIVHPAARGKWKKRDVYRSHLKEELND